MNQILEKLDSILKSKRILQPDQTIETALIHFTEVLPDTIPETEVSKYEKTLIVLLYLNRSNLSSQTSIRIANCLVAVYEREKTHKFWNLIQKVNEKPTIPTIFAAGQVIKRLGSYSRSSLPSLAQFLLETKDQLQYPSLFALKQIFKVCDQESLLKLASKTFSFAKSHIKDDNSNAQLLSLKLIRVLIKFEDISLRQFRNAADTGISHAHSDFAVELSASIAGAVAKRSISRLPGKDEKMNKKIYKETFDILKYFKDNFQLVFKRFLDLLEPEFVYNNRKNFFEFALSINPTSIIQINEFFGKDVRTDLFRILLVESKPNIKLLKSAAFDEESASDTAGIAFTALLSADEDERKNACTFFVSLSLTYPEVALENLHAAANFIKAPPEEGYNVDVQFNSMATLSAIVMAVLEEKNYAANKYKDMFQAYVETATKKCNDDAYAVPLLLLCASLSEYDFVKLASPAIKRFEKCLTNDTKNESKSRSYSQRLLEAALFYLSNVENDDALNIMNLLLQQPLQSMTGSSRVFLMKLCIKFRIKATFLMFIPYISPKAITRSYMSLLMSPMKEPCDYFQPLKGIPPNPGSIAFINDERSFGQSILMLLPDAFLILDEDDNINQLNTLLTQTKPKIIAYAAILQLYNKCPASMPPKFHTTLIKELSQKNIPQHDAEIIAESIAIHCATFPETLDDVIKFLKTKTTKSTCFLEGSLAKHVQISDNMMTAILYRLKLAVEDKLMCRYALHSLNTIYETKSQQLVTMMNGDYQIQLLLSVLYTPHCQDPYTMMLVYQCVERLLPILLPFLQNEATYQLLYLVISCFKNSIVVYSNELFHMVLRASIAFSTKLISQFPPLHYPLSPIASNELKLSVCGAMADASHITPIQDLFDLLPNVLILLQRTKDERAKNFVVALAQSNMQTNPERLTDWFKLCKQILSDNMMPGFGNAKCEPNTKVKACALTVMHTLIHQLIDQNGNINSACLDDLITSTTRNLEEKNPELHDIAYPLLSDVIDIFKDKEVENVGNVLEVYESQLSIAVSAAFPYSCDVASKFLVEYLTFISKNNNPESRNELITQIIEGLQKVRYQRSGYFAISTKAIEISIDAAVQQEDTSLTDFFKDYFTKMAQAYEAKITEAFKIRAQKSSTWEELASFRNEFAPYYERLMTCYIYLRKNIQPTIPLQILASFLALEAQTSTESWRICAGVSGITAILAYSKDEPNNPINENFSNFLINCVCDSINRNAILLKPITSQFVNIVCDNGYLNQQNFQGILYSSIKEKCSALTLAKVLMTFNKYEQYIQSLASHIVQMVQDKFFTEEEGIAVCTIIISNTDDMKTITDELLTTKKNEKFVLTCIRRCIEKSPKCCSAVLLSRLIRKTIDIGGLDLLAFLAVKKDPTFNAVLSRGVLTAAVSLCEKDQDICSTVFDLIEYILTNILEDESLELSALLNECMKHAIHWCCCSATVKQSQKVISSFARMLLKMKGKIDEEKIDNDKLSTISTYVEKEYNNAKRSTQKIELKSLSSSKLSSRRSASNDLGEWQSLEDSD